VLTYLAIGKLRGLQQCATSRGALVILALNDPDTLRALFCPEDPASVTLEQISSSWRQTVATLLPESNRAWAPIPSAILLDLEMGAVQCIASGALPGSASFVVAVKANGSESSWGASWHGVLTRQIEEARRIGASAAWLTVDCPSDSSSLSQAERSIGQLAEDCIGQGFPLFLEISAHSLKPDRKAPGIKQIRSTMRELARQLVVPGVDVLSVKLPPSINGRSDEDAWLDLFTELSDVSPVPWILASAATDYETYLCQLILACRAGASGTVASHAVWQEATRLSGEAHLSFLRGPAYDRMTSLTAVCNLFARPWTDFYSAPKGETG
jgi:tagatose-1,6-bisphosphate aldolase